MRVVEPRRDHGPGGRARRDHTPAGRARRDHGPGGRARRDHSRLVETTPPGGRARRDHGPGGRARRDHGPGGRARRDHALLISTGSISRTGSRARRGDTVNGRTGWGFRGRSARVSSDFGGNRYVHLRKLWPAGGYHRTWRTTVAGTPGV